MDEYIKREEAVKKIKSCIFTAEDAWESGYNTAMAEIMEWIKHMPSADVQPVKHGQWSECYTDKYHYSGICSNCGRASIKSLTESFYEYCPRCGARMDGDSE